MRGRVLVVANMWPGEGSPYKGIFVQRQVEALREAAPDWTFDVETIAGPRGRIDYLGGIPRLRRALRRGYDLVHAHYGFTGVTAALAGARPLITTLHGPDVDLAWQRQITRFAVWRSDLTIMVSERLRDAWGDPSLPILPCGVPMGVFRPRGRRQARERLGLPDDARVVLFPANPSDPLKDYPLFRRVVSQVRDQLGPPLVDLALDVPPDEVPWRMAASDVVVLTSRMESGPLVVKEALACGVPVVAVDVGDVPETLEGVRGCEVVPRDREAIGAAVERVLMRAPADPPDPSELRARILELGLEDSLIARRLLGLYEQVLEKVRPGQASGALEQRPG